MLLLATTAHIRHSDADHLNDRERQLKQQEAALRAREEAYHYFYIALGSTLSAATGHLVGPQYRSVYLPDGSPNWGCEHVNRAEPLGHLRATLNKL
eukprot:6253494-Pyramimonas_sp.AAC.1